MGPCRDRDPAADWLLYRAIGRSVADVLSVIVLSIFAVIVGSILASMALLVVYLGADVGEHLFRRKT